MPLLGGGKFVAATELASAQGQPQLLPRMVFFWLQTTVPAARPESTDHCARTPRCILGSRPGRLRNGRHYCARACDFVSLEVGVPIVKDYQLEVLLGLCKSNQER